MHNRNLGLAMLFLVALVSVSCQASINRLEQRIKGARAGQVIELPAGVFAGGVSLPAGVSLKGAGYGQTIIDASGAQHGLIMEGDSATLSDLTVRGARMSGVLVRAGQDARVQRVRVTGNIIGVKVENAQGVRLENVISDQNNYGIVIEGSQRSVVVNCTLSDCPDIGLSLTQDTGTIAFNNVIVNSSIGVSLYHSEGLTLDHNLYFGSYVGVIQEQIPRRILTGWQHLSGQDAHSLQMPVAFRSIDAGDFGPTHSLPWALDRAVTADWGVEKLQGVAAPMTDIHGQVRTGGPDLGVVETVLPAPRKANGTFEVAADQGIKSAGVFTKDGRLVSYLFHNLPLRSGPHAFWLPARDYVGKPIPAGEYEVRLVESNLTWQYLDHPGDNGENRDAGASASVQPGLVTFDAQGGLIMGQNWSEDHTNVRCYDVMTGKQRWRLKGTSNMRGVAVGTDGLVYLLRSDSQFTADKSRLTRLHGSTGAIQPFSEQSYHVEMSTGIGARHLAWLKGKLYTLNPQAKGLDVIDPVTGQLETRVMEGLTLLCADEKLGVLWVVRNGEIASLSPALQPLATHAGLVANPGALAARDGVLAVASRQDGKVHLFTVDAPNASPQPLRTVGRGDGPYGPYEPDRFLFQSAPGWESSPCEIALGPQGELAVVDHGRLIVLDQDSKALWYTFGIFGNQSQLSHGTNYARLWDTPGNRSFRLNERAGTWEPDAFWDVTAIRDSLKLWANLFMGDFAVDGKIFGVFVQPYKTSPHLTIVRYAGQRAVPVLELISKPNTKGMFFRKDTNQDGRIDDQDTDSPVLDGAGKPVLENHPFYRFNYLHANGDLQTPVSQGKSILWKCGGLDAEGVPIYRWADRQVLTPDLEATFINPYDQQLGGIGQITKLVESGDGGWTMQAILRGSGGTGANNGAGTDLLGFTAEGQLRWVHQLAEHKGIAGLGSANGVTVTTVFYANEPLAFDADGLGLGGFGEPRELFYVGYFIDHPNLNMYRGQDGQGYLTIGDNYNGRHVWYRMIGADQIIRARTPLHLSPALATTLAALEQPTATVLTQAKPRRIRIPQLTAPMTVDGELEKWREAKVDPQILIGAQADMDGPADCSVVIRMAYEAQNLYVQIIQFDDVPTFHQGVATSHMQDTVEMCLNGSFPDGFQFCTLKTPQGEDVIVRRRFFSKIKDILLDPNHSPRVVRVLENAADVTERNLIESIYGVDLAACKVIITEYKLPMDAVTFASAEKDIIPLGPGKTFWVGFMINDNDVPGTDSVGFVKWPSTFGPFNPKESGAIAECE